MNQELTDIETVGPAKLLISGETITEGDIEEAITLVIAELNETNDHEKVDNAITTMIGLSKMSLFSLAQLLYEYNLWWVRTEQEEETGDAFEHYIESIHGLKPTTMARYVNIWHKRSTGEFPKEITARPLKDQYAIADTLDAGMEINEDQWERLIDAQNTSQVHSILREVKGKKPTKASYMGYLEPTGDIVFWHREIRFHVGFIKPPEKADDAIEEDVLRKAQHRAVKGMGLIVRK